MECLSFSPNKQLKSTINKHTLTVKCRGQIGPLIDLPNSLDRATGCDSREVAKIGTLLPAGEKSATTHLGFQLKFQQETAPSYYPVR